MSTVAAVLVGIAIGSAGTLALLLYGGTAVLRRLAAKGRSQRIAVVTFPQRQPAAPRWKDS